MDWGPPITVKRKASIKDRIEQLHLTAKDKHMSWQMATPHGFWWLDVYSENGCVFLIRGWDDVTTIRLPAGHKAYQN